MKTIYDLRNCVDKHHPNNITETCGRCGKAFMTSVRAMASGKDVCRLCNPSRILIPSPTCMRAIPSDLFKTYYNFYESFWRWMNNRSKPTEIDLCDSAGKVLYQLDKPSEEMSIEDAEIQVLLNLHESYILWRLTPATRSWRRVFYAFWLAESFYKGAS